MEIVIGNRWTAGNVAKCVVQAQSLFCCFSFWKVGLIGKD